MTGLFLFLFVFLFFVCAFWWYDKRKIKRSWKSVAIRIGVTGTRGKTSLVRMIAGGLRAGGFNVIAKTSGSQTAWIDENGEENKVPRFVLPTILEQKRILELAAKRGAQVLVTEIMSIRPDYQKTESREILNLTHCVITNAKIDHHEQGKTREKVMASLSGSVAKNSTVIFPGEEYFQVLGDVCSAMEAKALPVEFDKNQTGWRKKNGALAEALGRELGIDEVLFRRGMETAVMDIGESRHWQLGPIECINLFAVNDLESVKEQVACLPPKKRAGLLNLRRDRQERTFQYIMAANEGFFSSYEALFVLGRQGRLFRRKLNDRLKVFPLSAKSPAQIMTDIKDVMGHDNAFQLIGMGNIKGMEELLDWWSGEGDLLTEKTL